MSDTANFDTNEKVNILFKKDMGFASTNESTPWFQETNLVYNNYVFADNLLVSKIPTNPNFNNTIALGDVNLTNSDFANTSSDYGVKEEITGVVRRYAKLILEPVPNSSNNAYYKLDGNGNNILVDALQFNKNWDLTNAKPYPYVLTNQTKVNVSPNSPDEILQNSTGGNWIFDIRNGVIFFPDYNSSIVNGTNNKPVLTFYKYIGQKGGNFENNADSSLNNVDISGILVVKEDISAQNFTSSRIKVSTTKIGIGSNSGETNQGNYSLAIGEKAGQTNQDQSSIAIGNYAANSSQGASSIAIGTNAGKTSQSNFSIALGYNAGETSQAQNSVAIGINAGKTTTHSNSIILNASSTELNSTSTDSLYISSIRNASQTKALYYNTTTKEITYSSFSSVETSVNQGDDVSLNNVDIDGKLVVSSNIKTIDLSVTNLDVSGSLHISSGTSGDCTLILEADTDNNNEADTPGIEFRLDGGVQRSFIGHNGSNALDIKCSGGTGYIRFFTDSTEGHTNGTQRMIIRNDGKIGIGTNSPNRTLDLGTTGQITFGDNRNTNGNQGIYWHEIQSGEEKYGIYRTAGSWNSPDFQQLMIRFETGIILNPGSGQYGKSHVGIVGGMSIGDTYYTTKHDNGIIVEGLVGIGTKDPSASLHVVGDVSLNSNVDISGVLKLQKTSVKSVLDNFLKSRNLTLITGTANVDASYSIFYSLDGIDYIGVKDSLNIFTSGNDIVYDSSRNMWFGSGVGTYSLAYSYDGIEWYGIEDSKGSNFSTGGKCIAINSATGFIVAGGEGTRTAGYSSDGLNWTYTQINAGTQTMLDLIYHESTGRFYGAFIDSSPPYQHIKYSTDGSSWTGINVQTLYSALLNVDAIGTDGNRIVAGFLNTNFASGGNFKHMIYSDDGGSTWNDCSSNNNEFVSKLFTLRALSIKYANGIWIAGGQQNPSNAHVGYTIARSSDGITWTGISGSTDLMTRVNDVEWNGVRWVAIGGYGSIAESVLYSEDNGLTWNALIDSSKNLINIGYGIGTTSSKNTFATNESLNRIKNSLEDTSGSHFILINSNTSNITTNTSNITTNTSNITNNNNRLNKIDSSLNILDSSINKLEDISGSHYVLINTNTTNIASNTSNISTNTSNIATHNTHLNILDNSINKLVDISNSHYTLISSNTSNIATHNTHLTRVDSSINKLEDISSSHFTLINSNTNLLAATAGIVEPSKAVIVSGGKDISGLNNITFTGQLKGPSTLIIDPAAFGDNTGLVVIKGGLQIDGSSTIINSSRLDISDHTILLASNASNQNQTFGAGIEISGNKTFKYVSGNIWESNIDLSASGITTTTLRAKNIDSSINKLEDISSSHFVLINSNTNLLSTQAGKATASKALIVDANKDISGLRNITASGFINITDASFNDNVDISNTLKVAYNKDISSVFGKAAIGFAGYSDFASFSHIDNNNSTNYSLLNTNDGRTIINAATNKNITFKINNDDKIRIDSNGNLGIGTISPTSLLQVAGDASFNNNVDISDNLYVNGDVSFQRNLDVSGVLSASGLKIGSTGVDFLGAFLHLENSVIQYLTITDGVATHSKTLYDLIVDLCDGIILEESDVSFTNVDITGTLNIEGLVQASQVHALYYNPTTNQITYDNSGGTGGITVGSDASLTSVDISNTLLIDGDVSINSNVDISGTLKGKSSNNQLALGSHIIPTSNAAFDLGNAEYKIRHLFLSDNSLWLGDENKINISDGKIRFKKRKKTTVPPNISAAGGNAAGAIEKAKERDGSIDNISQVKIQDWLAYARTFNHAALGSGIGNAEFEHIFTEAPDLWEDNKDITDADQSHITSVGTLTGLTMGGNLNLNSQNIINGGTIAGTFTGNLTGNADTATTAATVTTAAQPNITSVGTLTGLTSSGFIEAESFIGDISLVKYNIIVSSSKYIINTLETPTLVFEIGKTYRFKQDDNTNNNHPIKFYNDAAKTSEYSTNVTTNGTAGNAGSYSQIFITSQTPNELYYQCENHSNMGGKILILNNSLENAVYLTTTQTLTNKILTSPTITSPTITGTGAIAGTFTGNLTGNASTATILANARSIGGTSFNGSADINISYNNLTDKPTIPTNNNQLTNGAGYITSTGIPLQSGNNGKFLSTNGSSLSWDSAGGGGTTISSNNGLTSNHSVNNTGGASGFSINIGHDTGGTGSTALPGAGYSVNIGYEAGFKSPGEHSISIGSSAGSQYSGNYSINIGYSTQTGGAHVGNEWKNSIAIGKEAHAWNKHQIIITSSDNTSLNNGPCKSDHPGVVMINGTASDALNDSGNVGGIWLKPMSYGAGLSDLRYNENTGHLSYYGGASDDRLKFNEINITNALETIRQLNPQFYKKSFNMYETDISNGIVIPRRDDSGNKIFFDVSYNGDIGLEGLQWKYESGLIAQDVKLINDLSFAVKEEKRHYDNSNNLIEIEAMSLDYDYIFTYNIAATKELDIIVSDLSNNLLAANNKITQLEEENASMKTALNSLLAAAGLNQI